MIFNIKIFLLLILIITETISTDLKIKKLNFNKKSSSDIFNILKAQKLLNYMQYFDKSKIKNVNCTRDIMIYKEALLNKELWALKSKFKEFH